MEGGTVGDAAAQPTLPTGTDFSLGVSLSFCGGSVRKEASVGCAQLNRSEGSDWRAVVARRGKVKAERSLRRERDRS